jgi:protein-S-isoprenylcysteine O-methyltransferase Ste14
MKSVQSPQGGANVRLPPPLVFVALMVASTLVQQLGWSLGLPLPWPLLVAAGGAIVLAGLGLIASAFGWFRRTGQEPAPWKPSPELIAQGIYRRTRNPMYVGMTLIQLGLGVALDNLWMVALAPLGLLIVHYTAVRAEEAYLEAKFGEPYLRYKAEVPRYLW